MSGNSRLNLLCWEGYDSSHIIDPFARRYPLAFHAETHISDRLSASRIADGELENWDILNINNAYIRDFLYPRGMIRPLQSGRFSSYLENIHPLYNDLLPWSFGPDNRFIGIGQRFGPFNFVVNTKSISLTTARDQGFDLANGTENQGRYGILNYPDFNVFHFCIGANLNPFAELSSTDIEKFRHLAETWYASARLLSDNHHLLNQALIDREIDFYISGGVYTASPARLAGHSEIVAITPDRGPIEGKGGIIFTEITSVLNHSNSSGYAESFLQYMLESETAARIAFIEGSCNPVAQMGDPKVFNAFSKQQLDAIQWDQLDVDLSHCTDYRIPPNNIELLGILDQARSFFNPGTV